MKGVNTQSHRQGLTQSTFSKEVEALKKAYLEKLDLIGNVDPQLIEAVSQAVQQYQTDHEKEVKALRELEQVSIERDATHEHYMRSKSEHNDRMLEREKSKEAVTKYEIAYTKAISRFQEAEQKYEEICGNSGGKNEELTDQLVDAFAKKDAAFKAILWLKLQSANEAYKVVEKMVSEKNEEFEEARNNYLQAQDEYAAAQKKHGENGKATLSAAAKKDFALSEQERCKAAEENARMKLGVAALTLEKSNQDFEKASEIYGRTKEGFSIPVTREEFEKVSSQYKEAKETYKFLVKKYKNSNSSYGKQQIAKVATEKDILEAALLASPQHVRVVIADEKQAESGLDRAEFNYEKTKIQFTKAIEGRDHASEQLQSAEVRLKESLEIALNAEKQAKKQQAFGASRQALAGIFKQQTEHGASNNEKRLEEQREQARIKAEIEASRQAQVAATKADLQIIGKRTEERIEKYTYWGCMSRDKTAAKLTFAEAVVDAVKVAQNEPSETNLRKLASAIEIFETTANAQGSWTLSFFKESEAGQTENEKTYFAGVNGLIKGIEKTLGINLESGSVAPASPSSSRGRVVLGTPSVSRSDSVGSIPESPIADSKSFS